MTKKFVTRALLIAGLFSVGVTASFAQTAAESSRMRRVSPAAESRQPIAAAAVAQQQSSTLSLTPTQRVKIDALSREVSALHTERARLWSEYKSITARSDYSDDMAASQAAPRMLRIVEINNQLAPIVARQQQELNSVLTPTQQATMNSLVKVAKTQW